MINVTDFVITTYPFIYEQLTVEKYDTSMLTRRGHSIKPNGKVFNFIGRKVADDVVGAFKALKMKPRVFRPDVIYATDRRNSVPSDAKYVELHSLFFYANVYVEETK